MSDVFDGLDAAESDYQPASPEVAYRPPPGYRRPFLARCLRYLVLTIAGVAIGTIAPIGYFIGSIASVFTVGYGISYLWRGRFQTIVTARGIEIRRWSNRLVPWSSVRAIEIGGYGAASLGLSRPVRRRYRDSAGPVWGRTSGPPAKYATVTVVRLDDKRILLPAPLVTAWASDHTFTDKARQLQQLCDQYAGPVELRSTRPQG
ncbi:MAG TPA: hypothetical protein VMA72_02175 [Streptosporangiaceae bacterium]|nr:hypothetical protein [Streptosporangiaceae bacterium]